MITLDVATMILLYILEFLAFGAVLLQLHRLDRRRLREARCQFHQWEETSRGNMVCSVCHKRVGQSLIGFPKINMFDRDWPFF